MNNDRYLVILARNDDNDIDLLTTKQWDKFNAALAAGEDVYSAASLAVDFDEDGKEIYGTAASRSVPYFGSLGECFEYVRANGLVLKGGDAGIGY